MNREPPLEVFNVDTGAVLRRVPTPRNLSMPLTGADWERLRQHEDGAWAWAFRWLVRNGYLVEPGTGGLAFNPSPLFGVHRLRGGSIRLDVRNADA